MLIIRTSSIGFLLIWHLNLAEMEDASDQITKDTTKKKHFARYIKA
jgi:hypothetical protein